MKIFKTKGIHLIISFVFIMKLSSLENINQNHQIDKVFTRLAKKTEKLSKKLERMKKIVSLHLSIQGLPDIFKQKKEIVTKPRKRAIEYSETKKVLRDFEDLTAEDHKARKAQKISLQIASKIQNNDRETKEDGLNQVVPIDTGTASRSNNHSDRQSEVVQSSIKNESKSVVINKPDIPHSDLRSQSKNTEQTLISNHLNSKISVLNDQLPTQSRTPKSEFSKPANSLMMKLLQNKGSQLNLDDDTSYLTEQQSERSKKVSLGDLVTGLEKDRKKDSNSDELSTHNSEPTKEEFDQLQKEIENEKIQAYQIDYLKKIIDELAPDVNDDQNPEKMMYYERIEKKITHMFNAGREAHKMTVTELQCALMQSVSEILPSYEPIKISIFNTLDQKEGAMPQSHRTIALQILEEYDEFIDRVKIQTGQDLETEFLHIKAEVLGGEPELDRTKTRDLIKGLRASKGEFYDKIIQHKRNQPVIDPEELVSLGNQLKETEIKFNKFKKEHDRVTREFANIEGLMKLYVSTITKSQPAYSNGIREISRLEELHDMINDVNNFQMATGIDLELVKKYDLQERFVIFVVQLVLLARASNSVNIYSDVLFVKYKEKRLDEQEIMRIKQYQGDALRQEEFLQRQVKVKKGALKFLIRQKINNQTKKLFKIQNVKHYIDKFKKYVFMLEKSEGMNSQYYDFEMEMNFIENLMRRRGLSTDKKVDFVIGTDEIEDYRKNYRIYLEYMKSMGFEFKRVKTIEDKALEAKFRATVPDAQDVEDIIVEVDREYISGEELFTPGFGNFEEENKELLDLLKEPYRGYVLQTNAKRILFNEETEQAQELLKTELLQKQLKESYQLFKDKLQMAENLHYFEVRVDQRLGEVFARTYFVNLTKKCNLDTILSFNIFTMVKTNIIEDEVAFLNSFFETLFIYDDKAAKRFLLLMYSQLGSPDYTIEVAKALKGLEYPKHKDKLEKIVQNFASNYSVALISYKDLTNYAKNLETKKSTDFNRLTARFKRLIQMTFQKIALSIKKKGKGAIIKEMVEVILEEVVTVLTFIGGVPFLQPYIRNAVTKIVMTALNFVIEKLGPKMDELKAVKSRFYQELKNDMTHEILSTLDWGSLLANEFTPKPDGGVSSMQTKVVIEELEKNYFHDAYDKKSLLNVTEGLHVFELETHVHHDLFPYSHQSEDELESMQLPDDRRILAEIKPKESEFDDFDDFPSLRDTPKKGAYRESALVFHSFHDLI